MSKLMVALVVLCFALGCTGDGDQEAAGDPDTTSSATAADATTTAPSPAAATGVPATPTPEPPAPTPTPTPDPHAAVPASIGTYATARADGGIAAGDSRSSRIFPVFDTPGGEERTLTYQYLDGHTISYPVLSPTYFGNELVLRVLARSVDDQWLQVQSPARPNASSVWVRSQDFDVATTDRRLEIDIGTQTATVFDGSSVVVEASLAVGREERPSAPAMSFVMQAVPSPSAAYGKMILDLGYFSDAISTFSGGLPAIRLSGTSRPESTGRITSGGFRVLNGTDDLFALEAPPGTPVIVYDSTVDGSDYLDVIDTDFAPALTQPVAAGTDTESIECDPPGTCGAIAKAFA